MNILKLIILNLDTFIYEFFYSNKSWYSVHIRNNLTELLHFIERRVILKKDSNEELLFKYFSKLINTENQYYIHEKEVDGLLISERLKEVKRLIEKKATELLLTVDSKPESDPVPATEPPVLEASSDGAVELTKADALEQLEEIKNKIFELENIIKAL